jgi:hypothetical protein
MSHNREVVPCAGPATRPDLLTVPFKGSHKTESVLSRHQFCTEVKCELTYLITVSRNLDSSQPKQILGGFHDNRDSNRGLLGRDNVL